MSAQKDGIPVFEHSIDDFRLPGSVQFYVTLHVVIPLLLYAYPPNAHNSFHKGFPAHHSSLSTKCIENIVRIVIDFG